MPSAGMAGDLPCPSGHVRGPDLRARAARGCGDSGGRRPRGAGAGHGRDALVFARCGFTVQATDFSPTGLEQLRDATLKAGLADRVNTATYDVREALPLTDYSVDAVFAHMLLCMALSTRQIRALVAEVRRVLRHGGVFVYTVRHTGDAHYGTGIAHGDDIFEHGGFAVRFFPATWSTHSPTAGT
jgi:SAM-dependent methyltransferase